ncbi:MULTISPECIES: phosphoadenylyl-sulfate reductase [unclassified Sphingomonas]|uniref:phosphoadenylyl-sulfate reductase n=1 Tax=unclassified Sphingomonas TaxID=196159 RepID=UPI0006F64544|nr:MULTISPECIES: phosphoadenylyl-sulfate reductase [unclassified Sphingomonas]KQM28606.1 phosphoadenosine phosphosulfate reductase [Sphingomonas sp. Leaf9]KQM45310.1 phosphoadenosine phosphosulfate reductase [Sphingomonas sp. Leaf11]
MAEADSDLRLRDRIDIAPRFTAADAEALNARFDGVPTQAMLATALGEGLLGRVAAVSSFGAESAVLLHLIASVDRSVPVLFLETGKHFPETLAYRDMLVRRLGLTDFRNLTPDADLLAARDATGERWSYDPDGCCDLRKVEPLARGLLGFDASFTGRKAFQSATRTALPRFEIDTSDAVGRLKVNPLITWTPADIDAYFAQHDLPRHPLVEQGFPSIGCQPCTKQVKLGEDPRSGRWAGFDKVECGIHTPLPDVDANLPGA